MFSQIFCCWLSRTWPYLFKSSCTGQDKKISHLEYQWCHYNHNAKRYENVIRGISNYCTSVACELHAWEFTVWLYLTQDGPDYNYKVFKEHALIFRNICNPWSHIPQVAHDNPIQTFVQHDILIGVHNE